jgi:hypothetical protein
MPYAPYKPGPVSMAIAILVAIIALVVGVIMMAHHKDSRGVIFIAAAAAAAIIAVLARPRSLPGAMPQAGRSMPPTSASPTPSASRTLSKILVTRAMARASRHRDGRTGQESGRDGRRNRAPPPSVGFSAPVRGPSPLPTDA